MRGISYFLIVLGISYLVLVGMEYTKVIQSQNWTPITAKVEKSINGIPLTKFQPNAINDITAFVNWTFIRYNYSIGVAHYDAEKELGPHLSAMDIVVGPIKERLPGGKSTIEIRYNPRDPKESQLGFDVLRPLEAYGGTGLAFIGVGLILFFMSKINDTTLTDDQELSMPLEYFDKKRKELR